MSLLLPRIHKDLFDFIDQDPEDRDGLIEFWYQANSAALSAALTAQTGLSLIVNVSSFQSFENLSKKLFLLADTLVLRDTRKWTDDETGFRAIPIPADGHYQPGYYEDLVDELRLLRPSPLTMLYRPTLYGTSTTKTLNNGYHVAYAGWDYNSIPTEFLKWISSSGRSYMETGRVVYAPFIPPLEWELEFLKNGISLPGTFNATPTFHENYDWLDGDRMRALLSLQIPFLDGLDIDTISKVKDDHRDAFEAFSRAMLTSINAIKSSFGSDGFAREVRNIQENQINAGISDVKRTMKKIESNGAFAKGGILAGLLTVDVLAFFGVPVTTLVSGLGTGVAAMIGAKAKQLQDEGELSAKAPYFLWQLKRSAH